MVEEKCNECKHESICKYIGEKREIDSKIKNMSISFCAPFQIECKCRNWDKKYKRQDGCIFK